MKKICFLVLISIFQLVHAQVAQENNLKVENFPIPVFTNSNLSLLILGSAWVNVPVLGDEIAVVDSEGQFVGNSIVLEGHNGMPIWGDNPNTTVKDGLALGERFRIIHWSKELNKYYLYSDFKIQTGTVTYVKDGFTIVNSMEKSTVFSRASDVDYHLKSVLSEENKFSCYIQKKGLYSLKVYSSDVVLYAIKDTYFEEGFHSFNFTNQITENSYIIELSSNSKVVASKNFEVK